MPVRLKMDEGPNIVILDELDEVNRAFQAALESNEPITVQIPDGLVAVNPRRVLYLEEEPEGVSPERDRDIVRATLEVSL